jgi:3-hydroxyisobutyrate dehydrogenase-like beta-hydroxyacid dehydrogenase
MDQARVGFVGAGRMGLPMVERLTAAGTDLIVYARRPETRAGLERLGIRTTGELSRVAHDREVLLICVFDDDQLRELAEPLAAALPEGSVLASHVTAPVATLWSLAARFDRIGVVDAPVSGTPAEIRAGRLTVLLGGRPEDRARVGSVVRAYASTVIESGDLGTALATKLVNNLLMAANAQLVAEAVRLGESLGIASESLLAALAHMSGGSSASQRVAENASLAEFADRIRPFVRKDVAICAEHARHCGADPGLLFDVVRRGPLALG